MTVANTSPIMASSLEGRISTQIWGSVGGIEVKKYTIINTKHQEVDIITYGATITAVRTPDKNGKIDDIVLGFDNMAGYVSKDNPYFGATIGRVANRISRGRFTLDEREYQVSQNIGNNSLHGGFKGWNTKIWESSIQYDSVVMTLISEDGDEGYPGTVLTSVSFVLTDDGVLTIEMKSTANKATVINLTNHSYFNLAGHGTNAEEIYKHVVTLNSDRWTVTDAHSIPTGEIRLVYDSLMDFRKPVVLGDVINKVPGGGFDYNYCLPCSDFGKRKLVAQVHHPESGRTLEVHSNQPGVQFYTSNYFPEAGKEGIKGKQGKKYYKHGAFCLETQNYPDAINFQDHFPNSILRPHHLYFHHVTYKFGIQD